MATSSVETGQNSVQGFGFERCFFARTVCSDLLCSPRSAAEADSAILGQINVLTDRDRRSRAPGLTNMKFCTISGRIKHQISVPLPQAMLDGVDLSGVVLASRDLRDANFTGAILTGADFSGSDLRRAKFSGANLQGARFEDADLAVATLAGADSYAASFFGANLSDANLEAGDLRGADLKQANLAGALLRDADLSSDNLGGATELHGADLRRAVIAGAKFRGAEYDGKTRFPAGCDPLHAGLRRVSP